MNRQPSTIASSEDKGPIECPRKLSMEAHLRRLNFNIVSAARRQRLSGERELKSLSQREIGNLRSMWPRETKLRCGLVANPLAVMQNLIFAAHSLFIVQF